MTEIIEHLIEGLLNVLSDKRVSLSSLVQENLNNTVKLLEDKGQSIT